MVLPRPALIAILGGVLVLAVFAASRVAGQAEGETASDPAPAPAAQAPTPTPPVQQASDPTKDAREGLPAAVERALARHQVFVLLFTQEGSDDDATRRSVGQLDGVRVFRAGIDKIGDYRRVVSELGIDQAPAVVIVGRDGQARLVEGYTDPGSLAQQVEDAK
jgi:hypothetical protein